MGHLRLGGEYEAPGISAFVQRSGPRLRRSCFWPSEALLCSPKCDRRSRVSVVNSYRLPVGRWQSPGGSIPSQRPGYRCGSRRPGKRHILHDSPTREGGFRHGSAPAAAEHHRAKLDESRVEHVIGERRDPSIINSEMYLTVPKSLREAVVISRGGNVEAYDLDGSIEAETVGGRIQMDRIGTNVLAKTGGSDIRIGRVGGTLRCFSGGGSIQVDNACGETWCETAGGEIVVAEAIGALHATTAGGSIRVRRAGASVSARSDGGLIEVGRAGGRVTAQTRGGSIEVGSSTGVECESAAGAIRVRGLDGPLRAQTAMGSILAELLPGIRLQDSSLNTGAGDITVFIPSNVAVSVLALSDGRSRAPRIVSDFPEIQVKSVVATRGGPITAEGSLNGGGPLLRITANSGTVYLRRQR